MELERGKAGNIDMGEEKRGNWQDVPLRQWVEGGRRPACSLPSRHGKLIVALGECLYMFGCDKDWAVHFAGRQALVDLTKQEATLT